MTFARLAVVVAASLALVACGGASSSTSTSSPAGVAAHGDPAVAGVWRSKCGSCHVPVEPGSRARTTLETALARHHKRLRLSDAQWAQLVDFLAAPPDVSSVQ